jgi:hypothetical protein
VVRRRVSIEIISTLMLNFIIRPNSNQLVEQFEKTFPNVISLDVKFYDRVYADVEGEWKLVKLHLWSTYFFISVASIPRLFAMQKLSLESHAYRGITTTWFCSAMRGLKHLEIHSSSQVSMSTNSLKFIAMCCPHLQSFTLGRIGKYLNAERLKQVLQFFSSHPLQKLELNWNTSSPVVDDTVFEYLQGYTGLKRLSFWNRSPSGTTLSDRAIELIVMNCPNIEV